MTPTIVRNLLIATIAFVAPLAVVGVTNWSSFRPYFVAPTASEARGEILYFASRSG